MRLKQTEIQAITQAVQAHLNGASAHLYLFGSRLDDAKRGGDIDLLIVCESQIANLLRDRKSAISRSIQDSIGEQRIDITIATQEEISRDAFLRSILPTAASLKHW